MVIVRHNRGGWMVAELMIAVVVLAIAMIPLSLSFRGEQRLVRAHYNKVVAMEIIDGEMEALRAGQWRAIAEGENEFPVTARAATNLPSGTFLVTRSNGLLRLEWRVAKKGLGGSVAREILVPTGR